MPQNAKGSEGCGSRRRPIAPEHYRAALFPHVFLRDSPYSIWNLLTHAILDNCINTHQIFWAQRVRV